MGSQKRRRPSKGTGYQSILKIREVRPLAVKTLKPDSRRDVLPGFFPLIFHCI